MVNDGNRLAALVYWTAAESGVFSFTIMIRLAISLFRCSIDFFSFLFNIINIYLDLLYISYNYGFKLHYINIHIKNYNIWCQICNFYLGIMVANLSIYLYAVIQKQNSVSWILYKLEKKLFYLIIHSYELELAGIM